MKALAAALKCILTIILIGMITASIVGCVLVVYVVTSFNGSDIPDLSTINQNESSIIYVKDASGNFVESQRVEGANSVWTDLNNIPMNMQNAVIAIEDQRFREHYGVDWKRTASAFANLVFHFKSNEYGGSTITQQLIKNLSKDDDVKISRKIREIFRAIEMERKYSKDDIMEAYLNILPLSGNVNGVGAAANYYFAKDAKDLDLAQCALIAGITQNPSKYNPYTHPDNAKQRQKVVLDKMLELGLITEDEYKQAYNEELVYSSSLRRVDVQDYYTDSLTDDVINDLMNTYGYSKDYATTIFYFGGLHIYSAEDVSLQRRVEAVFENDNNFPAHNKNDNEDPQAGIAIMDYSGRMIATVGGRGTKTANRVFSRATDAVRQPGSAMKPIAVYAPAIEKNKVTFSTIVQDAPVKTIDGKAWPINYGKSTYGSLPLVDAVKYSLNTIPVQLIEQLTPKTSFDFLTNSLHISTLVSSRDGKTDITDALALGGLTDGVKCSEMAAAYQIFGNGGIYNKPFTYYSVKRGDTEILSNSSTNERAVSEDTAYVMNRILQHVVTDSHATGYGQQVGGFETFAKTGTTTDNKDSYFVGGTPYYVGACWYGYDDNETIRVTTYAKKLWKLSMDAIHSGLADKSFDKKGDTIEARYNPSTGRLDSSGSAVGVYKPDDIPGTVSDGTPRQDDNVTPANTTAAGNNDNSPTTAPPEQQTTAPSADSTTKKSTVTTSKETQGAKTTQAEQDGQQDN